jgi:TonB family protein
VPGKFFIVPAPPKSNRIVTTNVDGQEDRLKKRIVVSLLFLVATISFGQTQTAICPKHIETPEYPPLARQTRLMGEVVLSVTIDADGRVERVTAVVGSAHTKKSAVTRSNLSFSSATMTPPFRFTYAQLVTS